MACFCREHGLICSAQTIACQVSGEHWVMFLMGTDSPGRLSEPLAFHMATSDRAASSAFVLQLRNNSVGRLLKLVQKDSPSQPSSQGSSTKFNKFNQLEQSIMLNKKSSSYLHLNIDAVSSLESGCSTLTRMCFVSQSNGLKTFARKVVCISAT